MKKTLTLTLLILGLGTLVAAGAFAQTALPGPNAGFDMTGFIQRATRSQVGATVVPARLRGGTLTINNIEMIVPNNSIVQMPAAAFTWADLFGPLNTTPVGTYTPARPVVPASRTGLALTDPIRLHFPSYEVRVVGNIITDPVTLTQQYIVGLILPVAQQGLNAGSGYINFIDYDGTVLGGIPGRFRVGGTMNDSTTGMLCELNDPVGRFGAAHSPDPRFTADTNNPTITTATGYPVGIPTAAPTAIPLPAGEIGDPDRPYINRPPNGGPFGTDPFLPAGAPLKAFTMPASTGPGTTIPDPYKQVPLMVGDWIDYSGTLMQIDPLIPAGTVPGRNDPANMFVSVHTLTAHLGVRTALGTQPAYTRVEEFLFGVGDAANTGPTVAGIAQETSNRVALVAFTTDTDGVTGDTGGAIFGIYVDPVTGAETEVQFPFGSTALSPAGSRDDFIMDDPIRGRIRWNPAKNGRGFPSGAVSNAANPPGVTNSNFYREYVFKLTGTGRGQLQLPAQSNGLPGLIAGQYRLPIFDYIFGEGTNFGEPIPPYNFNDFGFLNIGSGRLNGTTGARIGALDPFPTFQ
jgi:hypothetical protein